MCACYCFLLKQEVKQLIHAALARYSADRIGKFDFALENVGGVVLSDKCSKTFSPSLATVSLFGFPLWHVTSSPRAIIQVRGRSVGEMNILRAPRCWMLAFLSHVMNLSICKGFIMIFTTLASGLPRRLLGFWRKCWPRLDQGNYFVLCLWIDMNCC